MENTQQSKLITQKVIACHRAYYLWISLIASLLFTSWWRKLWSNNNIICIYGVCFRNFILCNTGIFRILFTLATEASSVFTIMECLAVDKHAQPVHDSWMITNSRETADDRCSLVMTRMWLLFNLCFVNRAKVTHNNSKVNIESVELGSY